MTFDVAKFRLTLVVGALFLTIVGQALPADDSSETRAVIEARARARLLHETIHATLQIVHLEYYRENESLTILAATLERVFDELASRQKVELRWLAVNARAMNENHKSRDEFENGAVEALTAGKEEYEQVDGGNLRWAGAIALTSSCLRCHAPNRTSTKERVAALAIKLPLDTP